MAQNTKIKLFIGLILLLVGLAVGVILIQERQVTKQEAQEIPTPKKQITCSWDEPGTYTVRLINPNTGEVIKEQAANNTTFVTFRDLDPNTLPVPVRCEIVNPQDLSCHQPSDNIICAPPPTATPTPATAGCFESCEENEVLPRCAEGLECVHNGDGTKTCQDIEGILCPIQPLPPTATPTPTPSLSLTPSVTPSPTPTPRPGVPTNTPAPTLTPSATPSPKATNTPAPTPTTCPIPEPVTNLALACATASGQCTWNPSEGATYYLVTIKDQGTGLPIDGYNPNKKVLTSKAEFTAIAGHSYLCFVEAVNAICGGSAARQSNSCSYNPPSSTPNATATPQPSQGALSPTPSPKLTDIIVVNATNTPKLTQPIGPSLTSKPTLPATGLAHDSFIVAMIFALFGIGTVLAGLLIKI